MTRWRSRYAKDRVIRIALRGALLAVERLDAHEAHQSRDMPAAENAVPFALEHVTQHPRAGERIVQVQVVDLTHQIQVGSADRLGIVVQRAAREGEDFGLARERKIVVAVDHRFTLGPPTRPSAFSKKSFSSASWPIFACNVWISGVSPGLAGPGFEPIS
jgi:hypothetical protein